MSDTAAENKVIDEKPAEGKLPESKPAEASASESKPAESPAPEAKALDAAPATPDAATATPPAAPASTEAKPAEAATADAKPAEAKPGETKPAAKPPVTARPMRRPGAASAVRKAPGANGDAAKTPPPPHSHAKAIAIIVCGVLAAACVGMGIYLYARPKNTVPVKSAIERLDEKAKDFAVKLEKAVALYQDGQAKAASEKYEEMTEADAKLTEASGLFNEIVESGQTIDIDDIKQKVQIARDKRNSIDTDLLALRKRIDKIDTEKSYQKSKTTQANKPADTPAAPAAPTVTYGKVPTKEEYSDENLKKLFDNDPSEYERIAKYREQIDPTFKAKKP